MFVQLTWRPFETFNFGCQNFEKHDFIKKIFSIYDLLPKYREFYGDFEYPLGFPWALNLGIKFNEKLIFFKGQHVFWSRNRFNLRLHLQFLDQIVLKMIPFHLNLKIIIENLNFQ